MITRRNWLLSSVSASLLVGCAANSPDPPFVPIATPRSGRGIIDVHCHIFNGSDLAIRGYVSAFVAETLGSRWLAYFLPLGAAQQVYAGASLGVQAEADLLSTTRPGQPLHAMFYRQKRNATSWGDWREGVEFNFASERLARPEAQPAARPPVVEDVPEGGNTANFLGYVSKPRASLALILDELTRASENAPVLLTPALVDMTNWVNGNDNPLSWLAEWTLRQLDRLPRAVEGATGLVARTASIPEQMQVMRILSERRPEGLLIHPFVPYDPWRGAIALAAGGLDDALRDVQDAIERQGAVGVKLYPPMGFRATDNKELSERHPAGRAFPIEFEDAIRVRPVDPAKTPGEWLDDALAGLYDWCARNGVPIMAHTGPSHAGNGSPAYFNRAAPRHWRAVLARHEELKVNLGHFGGIWHWQEDGTKLAERVARCLRDTNDSQGVEDCNWEDWPAEVGRIMGEPRFAGRVFADMADVLLPPGGGTDRFIARFRSEFRDQPQITRGLMYGSDFPFTVMEGDFAGYRQNFEKAFRDLAPQGLGYDETRMNDIMCGNAARFLGLTRARGITRRGRTVDRLVDFHVRATLNEEAPEIRRTVPDEQRRQKAKRVIEGLLEPFLVEPDGAAVGPTQPPANPVARPRSRRARLGLAS